MGSEGPSKESVTGPLGTVGSSNHVGRTDLIPIACLEAAFLTLSLRKL